MVLRAAPAPEGWNARFSAIGRAYRYRILNRRAAPGAAGTAASGTSSARSTRRRWQRRRRSLLGRHDFTSFRAAACQANSPLRTLDRLDVTRDGDLVEIVAEARSFLHHQVRNMVGTLKLVGDGRWPAERVAAALAARDRARRRPDRAAGGADA